MVVKEKENDDELMKLIKKRFSELPVISIKSIWKTLQNINNEDQFYIVYQASNRIKESIESINPLVYIRRLCELYKQGFDVFTEHCDPNYKAIG